MHFDYILVGQGIAGSLLAYEFIRRDKKIAVYDIPEKNHCSSIAAGLFNPITGRRFGKTWKADRLFPFLLKYYPELEKVTSSNFFHQRLIFRPFLTIQEQNEVLSRSSLSDLGGYIDHIITEPTEDFPVYNDLGGVFLKHTGYIDIPELIKHVRNMIIESGAYFPEYFNEKNLLVEEKSLRYGNVSADAIIFCTGSETAVSEYFGWLPFRPVKGEMIRIKIEKTWNFIFNRQVFILPLENHIFKVGATYDRDRINLQKTHKAKQYFEEKLRKFLHIRFKIIDQVAGIRPATLDRRPFIGMHPLYKNVGIFNGLGSKGVTLGPYFAKNFVEFLLENKELEKEVNIKRYIYLNS